MIPLSTVSCVSVSLGFIYLRGSSGLTGHGAGVGGALIERYKNTFNLQYAVVNRRITRQIHERLRGRSTRVFSTWS